MKKKSGCMAGLFLGSVLKFIFSGIELLIKIIAGALLYFGLWLPFIYVLFGFILYFVFRFNPLDWTMEGQLYVSGLIACAICSIIITIKNIIVKPAKSIIYGYKKPVWKTEKYRLIKEDNIVEKRPKPIQEDTLNHIINQSRPDIYYSTVEDDTLIHEYSDRFEIYRVDKNKARLERVEFKNNEEG